MAGLRRPEDFDVWKLAWELKRRVFAFTAAPPASGDRRFCDDVRRAARAGPDLIAEGYYRFNPREFHRFLNDAKASLGEVRNQILHAKDQRFVSDADFLEMLSLGDRAIGAANALQAYLRTGASTFANRPRSRAKRNDREHVTQERVNQKQVNQDRVNQQRMNQQRVNPEHANAERANQERPNADRPNQDRPNQERPNQEHPNQERANQERANQERANQERANPEPRTQNQHPEPQHPEPRTVRSTLHRF